MTGKKRTTVTIYGHQYTIVSEESEMHVQEVSQHVHQKMKEMKKVNPFIDTSRLAVLAAVNIADDYLKLKKELESQTKKED
ncbi:cell division protein ZapA [Bacillaceae bacterium JMAK1]|nr:cell division protein ZapA [Bacillaceae bacterium JMAK1]